MTDSEKDTIESFDFGRDVKEINGYSGIDKLSEVRFKYKEKIKEFQSLIEKSPAIFDHFMVNSDMRSRLSGLYDKFGSNEINISVVAEVSSGKSTFLNALVFGDKILDAKIGETTAKIFRISYGEDTTPLELKNKISSINKDAINKISSDQFALEDINVDDYIVNLTAENENLKKGVVLYDTPGFGTLNEKVMSKLIKESVNMSDAVVLLLDISQGLKKSELKFVEEALLYIKENKRFIVLNKFDASFSEDDDQLEIDSQINKVVSDTKKELLSISNGSDEKLLDRQTYYLSALKALSGKKKKCEDTLHFSRFPDFEESFWNRVIDSKKELLEDNASLLAAELSSTISEANKIIQQSEELIARSKESADNIEEVSSEVNSIICEQLPKIDSLNNSIDEKANFANDIVAVMRSNIERVVSNESRNVASSIPQDSVTKDDFVNAANSSFEKINQAISSENESFVSSLVQELASQKEEVNRLVVDINNEMNTDKFSKLNFKPIPEVSEKNITSHGNKFTASHDSNYQESEGAQGNYYSSADFDSGLSSVSPADSAKYVATGAAIGSGLGALVPVIGNAVGGFIGGAVGGIISLFSEDDDREQERAEIEERHQEDMQRMYGELAKERARAEILRAKRDLEYEIKDVSTAHLDEFINANRGVAVAAYQDNRNEILSSLYHAKSILKDMKTIIEDPTEHKNIIETHKNRINEAKKFSEAVYSCAYLDRSSN